MNRSRIRFAVAASLAVSSALAFADTNDRCTGRSQIFVELGKGRGNVSEEMAKNAISEIERANSPETVARWNFERDRYDVSCRDYNVRLAEADRLSRYESYIKVTKAEHVRGIRQREPNLFYVQLGSMEALDVREKARKIASDAGVPYLEASKVVVEDIARQELSRLGLCNRRVQIASEVERVDKHLDLRFFVRCIEQ
jgi:hypothetical protein